MIDPSIVQLVSVVLGPAGAAFVAVKASLNGTRSRVQRIETSVDRITESVSSIREDVAFLKGKQEGDG